MRYGEFLVSSGTVAPMAILEALHFQRQNQTPLGQVALSHGLLSVHQVVKILDAQADRILSSEDDDANYLFGELSLELGFLDEDDVAVLLELQMGTRPPLGQALVELGLMAPRDLVHTMAEYKRLHVKDDCRHAPGFGHRNKPQAG